MISLDNVNIILYEAIYNKKGDFTMKIDSAIKAFSERYNRDMITSIDTISREKGLVLNGATMKLSNLKESFEMFNEYLKGYAGYMVENKENPNASPHEVIRETVDKFISDELFKESNVKYTDLPQFVQSYVEGVNTILETIDSIKSFMSDAEVVTEAVSDVNDFVDSFMTRLDESFTNDMDRILWASGYNSAQKLFGKHKKEKHVFA